MRTSLRSSILAGATLALFTAAAPQSADAQAVTVSTAINFDGTNGDTPYASLTLARDGNFYGTTRGNPDDRTAVGTIFKLTPAGALTTLANFTRGTDGSEPIGGRPNGLVQGTDGDFYGTTREGGLYSAGTVFRVTSAGAVTILHSFGGNLGADANGNPIPDGATPEAALIQARDGNFYGTTSTNAGGYGAIFAVSSSGAYAQPAVFVPNASNDGNGAFGRNPAAALLQGSDGNFYGTTPGGGPGGQGTVFKYTPGSGLSVLVNFTGPNGSQPDSELIQGSDGNFYGTTVNGGTRPNISAAGTVFRLTPAGQLTTLVNFDLSNGNAPKAALVQGRDGNFYGTASSGGVGNFGTVFKLTPAGTITTLYSFPDNGSKGAYPYAALIQGASGDLYGTTILGGSGGHGTIFRVNISPNAVQEATLGNIATRLPVGTSDNALIGGFIVTGTNPKRVIIRGIGPSLSVPDALADPTLELRDSTGQLLAFNDDWKDTQQAAIEQTGIPPSNQVESAIVVSLAANNSSYTAILRGKNGTTGRGVVEVYDLDQSVDSRLANISTRGLVGTGDNALIGGFISGPNTKVVVRAIGPSLAQSGVKNPLLDPTLELRDSNGVVVRSNNDWKDTQQAELQASGIAPTNDRESALVVTLTADSYTAIVRGLGDTSGVGVVEVYDVK